MSIQKSFLLSLCFFWRNDTQDDSIFLPSERYEKHFVFSVNSDRFPTIPLGHFTTHWYETILADPDVWDAFRVSGIVSITVAILATFIGFCTAYTDYRYNFTGKAFYLSLALLPPTIPLVIMGLAMLALLARINMSGEIYSIVVSHVVLCSPFAMAVIRMRLAQIDPNLESAAWNLGAFRAASAQGEELASQVWEASFIISIAQDLIMGLRRAFYILDLEPEVKDKSNPEDFPETIQTVSFENVAFSYEKDHSILSDISLEANFGTITAIVGGTGSGKSTLLSLLLRLYDPDKGTVLINGIDIRDFSTSDLRAKVSIALQQNVLFAKSVKENIAYGLESTTDSDIIDASKIACAHDFINEMPSNYETELGERGGKLSTGQRQRLSIARALLKNTPILILDEPTASLDAETEKRVMSNIAKWGQNRIIFVITHRLSTIKSADRIAVLDSGVIKEFGSHQDLMELKGDYAEFVKSETGED